MGAPLELLKDDIKLKNTVIRWLIIIAALNAFFVLITLGLLLYFFDRRPREVERAIEELKMERNRNQIQIDSLRQEGEMARRAKDSATVERLRAERTKAELEQLEKKYK